jgi:bacteriocin biosynthesis cyclodehydratase domain-containing protein
MVIRLDPRYPLVWRSPDTIQLGIDNPVVVIAGVTPALERVIAALRGGVPRGGVVMLGRQAGASDADISALLRLLRPALLVTPETARFPRPAEPAPPAVCVDGQGPTADRILRLLSDLGIPAQAGEDDAALAVLVGHFALEPARHGRWLRRDLPHLPVLFSDSEVRVGPLVEPGTGPCLHCLELAHVDEDPAWPAIACQLLFRQARTETARASIDVAALVAGLVQDRLTSGVSELTQASLAIDGATGAVRRRAHRPHERCGCQALPGTATAPAASAAAGRWPPSSARAAAAPA